MALTLSSCTVYDRYEYNSQTLELGPAKITLAMNGYYNEKALTWGAPYTMQFWVEGTSQTEMVNFQVSDLRATGLKSKARYQLGNSKTTKFKQRESSGTMFGVVSYPFGDKDFVYESYRLTGELTLLLQTGESHSQSLNLELIVNPGKERRVDKFDEIMSV